MRILVIGGTGLISSAITRHLLERGEDVTLFNRGQTRGSIPPGSHRILGERRDYAAFEARMAEASHFDCVIEMIGMVPEDAESLVRAFAGRTDQLIFCSTTDVYRKPACQYPVLENEPRLSTYAYGQNKARCEDILMEAHHRGDFKVTIIRPGPTYGEGTGIFSTFGRTTTQIDRIRKGKPLIVHGDGSTLTVVCHVDDLGRAFADAIGSQKAFGKAYHATGEEWLTWHRYHELVAEAIGAPAPTFVHIPTDILTQIAPGRARRCFENYQHHNIYDNSAARTDLGFRYVVRWKEGVCRAVTWLDEHGQMENSDDDPFDDQVIAAWEETRVAIGQALPALP